MLRDVNTQKLYCCSFNCTAHVWELNSDTTLIKLLFMGHREKSKIKAKLGCRRLLHLNPRALRKVLFSSKFSGLIILVHQN